MVYDPISGQEYTPETDPRLGPTLLRRLRPILDPIAEAFGEPAPAGPNRLGQGRYYEPRAIDNAAPTEPQAGGRAISMPKIPLPPQRGPVVAPGAGSSRPHEAAAAPPSNDRGPDADHGIVRPIRQGMTRAIEQGAYSPGNSYESDLAHLKHSVNRTNTFDRFGPGGEPTERLFDSHGAAPTMADLEGRLRLKQIQNDLAEEDARGQAIEEATSPMARATRARAIERGYEDLLPAGTEAHIRSSMGTGAPDEYNMDYRKGDIIQPGLPTMGEQRAIEQSLLHAQAQNAPKLAGLSEDRAVRSAQITELNKLELLAKELQADVSSGKTTQKDAEALYSRAERAVQMKLQALAGGKTFMPHTTEQEMQGETFAAPPQQQGK